jgi:hypothetical protein
VCGVCVLPAWFAMRVFFAKKKKKFGGFQILHIFAPVKNNKNTHIMQEFQAIYSTPAIKNIEYGFSAIDNDAAKAFCSRKFSVKQIELRNLTTGEVIQITDNI